MDRQNNSEKTKARNPITMGCLHILAIGYAVYLFWTILRAYQAGGPSAPGLSTLIVGGILLLGGSLVLAWFSLRFFRQARAEQTEETPQDASKEDEES